MILVAHAILTKGVVLDNVCRHNDLASGLMYKKKPIAFTIGFFSLALFTRGISAL